MTMKKMLILCLIVLFLLVCYLYYYRQKTVRELSTLEIKKIVEKTTEHFFSSDSSSGLPYRLFSPKQLDEERKYPLILYLHGGGGLGSDNLSQLEIGVEMFTSQKFQNEFESYIVIPQCPDGHQWVDIMNESAPYLNYNQKEIPESDYLKLVIGILKQIKNDHRINPDRVYVIGYSMGGTGAWDILTRHPEMFAGAVVLNGRSDPSQATKISKIPIWVFHGKFDRVSPISNSHNMVKSLKLLGSPVKLTELYWGHGIQRITYDKPNLFNWLFSKRRDGLPN